MVTYHTSTEGARIEYNTYSRSFCYMAVCLLDLSVLAYWGCRRLRHVLVINVPWHSHGELNVLEHIEVEKQQTGVQ